MQLTALQGLAILKAAWDAGINTIDTVNAYSNGESEKIIGNFIVKVGILLSSRPTDSDVCAST